MAPPKAPPGSWRQFLALVGGFLLLLIFAPSGSSPSAHQRTVRYVFSPRDIDTTDGSATNQSHGGSYKKKKSGPKQNVRFNSQQSSMDMDPLQWKHLSPPHSSLESESIGQGASGQQLKGVLYTSEDPDAIDTIDAGESASGQTHDHGSHDTACYDRWYVLDSMHSSGNGSFELRATFPLETSIDLDLDVSVWTLQGAQASLPKDVRLAEHFSEGAVMLARVRLSRTRTQSHVSSSGRGSDPAGSSSSSPSAADDDDDDALPLVSYSLWMERMYLHNTVTHSGLLRGITRTGTAAIIIGAIAVVAGYLRGV
ncbi:hypothetical protein B0O80DRAFT_500952 [Mortierella sp. GBAus27b]|nr:hypothetical protein BGX31_007706 [Mortierella sp. GBA43]KAI8350010.1 hypothetical protein B0O80DRAFT_500952 [Mortierella sp. GBAus27b]